MSRKSDTYPDDHAAPLNAGMASKPKITLLHLPAEILINIVQHFDGDSFNDINHAMFEVAKVSNLFKCIVFEVVFSINFNDGLSIGYEHYLDGRLAKLQTLQLDERREITNHMSAESRRLHEVARKANPPEMRRMRKTFGPLTLSATRGFMPNTRFPLDVVETAVRRWDAAEVEILAKCKAARVTFTKETKEIFAFQTTFGNRRKWVRGDMGDWMWTEIVAARIQNDLCEDKAALKVQDTL